MINLASVLIDPTKPRLIRSVNQHTGKVTNHTRKAIIRRGLIAFAVLTLLYVVGTV